MENIYTADSRKAYIFFVGGAADKEPFQIGGVPLYPAHHILGNYEIGFKRKLKLPLMERANVITYYYSYLEKNKITEHIKKLQALNDKPYIAMIGHSYGASTAYRICTEIKNNIDMLVGIEPVGAGLEGIFEQWIDLEELLKSKVWVDNLIFVVSTSSLAEISNFVSLFGGKWSKRDFSLEFMKTKVPTFIQCKNKKISHEDVPELMQCKNGKLDISAENLLKEGIKNFFKNN